MFRNQVQGKPCSWVSLGFLSLRTLRIASLGTSASRRISLPYSWKPGMDKYTSGDRVLPRNSFVKECHAGQAIQGTLQVGPHLSKPYCGTLCLEGLFGNLVLRDLSHGKACPHPYFGKACSCAPCTWVQPCFWELRDTRIRTLDAVSGMNLCIGNFMLGSFALGNYAQYLRLSWHCCLRDPCVTRSCFLVTLFLINF